MINNMPNLHHSGWMKGRHWGVMYRCFRCGRVETIEYCRAGNDGNLQCQPLPKDWVSCDDMILCPDCAESFCKWMEEVHA